MPTDLQILALRVLRTTAPEDRDNKIALIRDVRNADSKKRHLGDYKTAVEWAMACPPAASLPPGTVIATAAEVFIRSGSSLPDTHPWLGNDYSTTDEGIDDMVQAGEATILRVGNGAS